MQCVRHRTAANGLQSIGRLTIESLATSCVGTAPDEATTGSVHPSIDRAKPGGRAAERAAFVKRPSSQTGGLLMVLQATSTSKTDRPAVSRVAQIC